MGKHVLRFRQTNLHLLIIVTPTPSIFGPQAGQEVINTFVAAIGEGIKNGYNMFWYAVISMIANHWVLVLIISAIVLVIAIALALGGRWGMLGSVFYHYLYWGAMIAVGLVWGPDIFTSNIFTIISSIIFYPVCFFIAGWLLDKTGLRDIY